MLRFVCESCGTILEVPDSQKKQRCICPKCKTQQTVPDDAMPDFSRPPPHALIVTTGNDVAGRQIIAYLGIVRGIVVRSTSIGQGLMGGLRSIGGGNIPEYVEVCEQAREHAYQLMVQHAQQKNADALIAVRYDATEFSQGTTEVLAYGTAVKLAQPVAPPIQPLR